MVKKNIFIDSAYNTLALPKILEKHINICLAINHTKTVELY